MNNFEIEQVVDPFDDVDVNLKADPEEEVIETAGVEETKPVEVTAQPTATRTDLEDFGNESLILPVLGIKHFNLKEIQKLQWIIPMKFRLIKSHFLSILELIPKKSHLMMRKWSISPAPLKKRMQLMVQKAKMSSQNL